MEFGLALFSAYYLNKKDENQSNEINIVEANGVEEVSNIKLSISNLDNLNPILSKNQNVQDISKLIYEPLFYVTDDFRLENALAIEWSKSKDTEYFIKIRKNVKWHNGNDFLAEDVKFTIEKIKELGNDSIYFPNVEKINEVEIIGINLIRFSLSEEVPFFEYNLTFPIICSSFFGDEDIRNTEKNKIPMGTGMYKINSVDLSNQIELRANQSWWNIENINPRIEKINIKIYSSISEAYNAYKLGSIDMLKTTNFNNIEEYIGTIGFNIKENYGRDFDYLVFNIDREATSNKEVRQAINYALNKQEIINSIYNGKYIEADYVLSYGSYLYNKDNIDYEYNPDRSKQILNDNGWEYKNKYWQKKIGNKYVRLKLNLLVNDYYEKRVEVANKIKEQLEYIGIQVNIISVKDRTFDNYISNMNYDMYLTGMTIGLGPNLNRFFGENNFANYSNEEARKILKEVNNIADENTLKEKYNRLQKIYLEDRAYIGLYFSKITTIYTKNLSGNIYPTWYNPFHNIETWYIKK